MKRSKRSIFYFGTGLNLAVTAILVSTILLVIIPQLQFSNVTQPFSQIWILGHKGEAAEYPFNLNISNSYSCQFFVVVKNNLGQPANYSLRVKICNRTDLLPSHGDSIPSSVRPIYHFEFHLADDEIWESLVDITIPESAFIYLQRNMLNVTTITINDLEISGLNLILTRNTKTHGYPFLIFFELWIYDSNLQEFSYNDRFVSLWLNLQP